MFAAGSRALVAFLALSCLLLAAAEVGRLILSRLPLPGAGPVEMTLFRTGLGASLLSLAGLGLGLGGRLERSTVWAFVGVLLALAIFRGWRRFRAQGAWRVWLQARIAGLAALELSWLEGACVAFAAAALLAAFTQALAPEVESDAVRLHLALARRFAESGRIDVIEQFPITSWPLLAQVLYAVGLIVDDAITAKLLHAAAGVGLTLAAAVAAGKLAGRTGAVVAAALVATLPMVGWLLGTAYVDLFAAFYSLLAAAAILNWQRTGGRAWLLLAGAELGSAVAAKLTAGFVGAGLGLAVFLLGRRRGGIGERLVALIAVGLGSLLALGPWLARSAALTGEIPGARLLLDALPWRGGPAPVSLSNLPSFGTGRGLAALLRLPWNVTFHTGRFAECMDGFAGLALLGLLPLIVLLPRTRATAGLVVTTLVATLLWFFTAQYLRYVLPAIGLLAVLLGIAFAQLSALIARNPTLPRRVAGQAYSVALAGSLAFAPMLFLSTVFFVYPGSLPVAVLASLQTPEEYLARRVPSFEVLRRLDRMIRPGAGVVMLPDGPQLYSRARLISNMTGGDWILSTRSADELAARFAEHGVHYLIIEYPAIPPAWKSAPLFRPEFLERYARLVYVHNNGVCLYRVSKVDRRSPRTGRTARSLTVPMRAAEARR
jgi:hypothetical protein